MRIMKVTLILCFLGMLTACVAESDLDNLQDTVANDVEENQRFAIAIEEYKDTNSYTFSGVDGDNVELSSSDLPSGAFFDVSSGNFSSNLNCSSAD